VSDTDGFVADDSVVGQSAGAPGATRDSRYWPVPVLRGVVALAIAITITFSAEHSPLLGYLTFGILAVATALILGLFGSARLDRGTERSFFYGQAAVSLVAGIVALLSTGAGVPFLLFLVSAWAAITGFLELYIGIRGRRRFAIAKDWLFTGALTALLAVVVLLIPADFAQEFIGPDDVARVLTASVIADGIIGAYAALLGVYLVIAGLSLKWGTGTAGAEPANPATQGGN